ncbi:MAG: adhesin [Spiroplasma sp. hy2]|uniref:adhesin n=1 Tax=Spiroplasma sp. hy2 TaxID=2490850 RepID=UPI003847359D
MKKLLNILTITTLTASIPAPLLANIVQTRVKRDVSTLTSNSNNDYLPIREINYIKDKVSSLAIDKNNNIYFVHDGEVFKLSVGSDTPTKISGIDEFVYSVAVDSSNNIYFGKGSSIFVFNQFTGRSIAINGITGKIISLAVDSKGNLYFVVSNLDSVHLFSRGQLWATPIDGINGKVLSVSVDNNDNVYFGKISGLYLLKKGSSVPTQINDFLGKDVSSLAIDKNNNIYFARDGAYFMQTALSWVKQQSKFTLVDSTKTQTWTRPDLLSVDGELNIDIANSNIDKVLFDNVPQGQTNKQWKINVKPETAPRDHNLQVTFTLDGKQYNSKIIVSMQAKIDPPPTPVQQNLSDLIKTTDLGNILDNNDDTIFAAVNQKNGNVIDDFSQVEITDKTDTEATLTAKTDSKSYKGSVDVKYNVVLATVVDLKIDVTPTSSTATVIKDYLGQIDTSNITNRVNTFYHTNSESVITMIKPTESSVITGVVYGCDDKWNKTSQSSNIDPTSGIKLDGSQLATKKGKYVVELSDNIGHTNNVYLQINEYKKDIKEYWNTDNGKQFEIWAKANGHDNIRGSSASQLNKLFAESKNWQQLVNDSQFASAVADWFKTNAKLASKAPLTKEQVIEQLKKQIPNDIKIPDVNTSNYDVNKVSFELNQSEFNPNDKVNITVKYNNATSEQFTLQIKNTNTPDNNKKTGLGIWTIFGIGVGSLAGLALLGWLFKKFVVDPFILKPIREKKEKAFVAKTEKDIAQMKKDDEEWEAKQKGDK